MTVPPWSVLSPTVIISHSWPKDVLNGPRPVSDPNFRILVLHDVNAVASLHSMYAEFPNILGFYEVERYGVAGWNKFIFVNHIFIQLDARRDV